MTRRPTGAGTLLLAGGGSGGHIYPNVAIAEQLAAAGSRLQPLYAVSERPIDRTVCEGLGGEAWAALPAVPMTMHPVRMWRWWKGHRAAIELCEQLIRERGVTAVVSTGGFVGGPAVAAASRQGVPSCLVNLDAVPGKANRWSARRADEVFTAYDGTGLPRAQRVGVPLREASRATHKPEAARWQLGLSPDKPTLLVTAGSQGATSINAAMVELVGRTVGRRALKNWEVVHLTGSAEGEAQRAAEAYERLGVRAVVEPFRDDMGLAWSAAELAVCRAGAGTVAEAWASGTPAVFLPYPHHRDQHQRHNAEPLVRAGGALLADDHVDPVATVGGLLGRVVELLSNAARREAMRQSLMRSRPPDGAGAVARWAMGAGSSRPAGTSASGVG
ncbi:MAG: UDP-N-acetylglucosamine--N-acetylmuramyl-(pentapeptide) pyrophosphoryl-undecaprenol N-acetylglucosamine transferase [Planctomycetota bacterium]